MKRFLAYLGLAAFLSVPLSTGAFAWDMVYLNPLPYIGIGCNQTKFSLNPIKGFKNCEPCKKVEKCDRCAIAEPLRCTSCGRSFMEKQSGCGCKIKH